MNSKYEMEKDKSPIRILVPDLLFPDAAAFLRTHGCTIEPHMSIDHHIRTTVTLPAGSIRTLESRAASERHRIALPDGTVIRQVYDPSTGNSALFTPTQRAQKVDDEL